MLLGFMRYVYGTLGWHVEYLQPIIKSVENLDTLVFYYGYINKEKEKKQTIETKEKMVDICGQLGIKAKPRKLDDIFDFVGIVKRIKRDIEKDQNDGNEITLFNIAGGTKPMCSAALMVCIFQGVPTQYVNEETGDVIPIPLLRTNYLDPLSKKEREIAEFLLNHKDKEYTQVMLAKAFGKERATINNQVKSLVKKGIIELIPAKDGRSKIIKTSEGMELLFE